MTEANDTNTGTNTGEKHQTKPLVPTKYATNALILCTNTVFAHCLL